MIQHNCYNCQLTRVCKIFNDTRYELMHTIYINSMFDFEKLGQLLAEYCNEFKCNEFKSIKVEIDQEPNPGFIIEGDISDNAQSNI